MSRPRPPEAALRREVGQSPNPGRFSGDVEGLAALASISPLFPIGFQPASR